MQWLKQRNILAFPYGWQYPAKTEEWAYVQCLKHLPENHFIQVLCFPWATLIDLLRAQQLTKAAPYLDALRTTPPRMTLVRATICQHIYMSDMLPYFKQLKITDVFWSHARVDQTEIEGIRIHPFPLYPVRCQGLQRTDLKPLTDRRYLYSFIGAYQADFYLTPVRQWLFDWPELADALVVRRDEWHYEQQVYVEQISGQSLSAEYRQQHQQLNVDYEAVLRETVFCLCPSGSGPNSIRLWEALGFGCVPVIMADQLQLPGGPGLWASATLQVPESEATVRQLPDVLRSISLEQFSSSAAEQLWQRYGLDNFIADIMCLSPLGGIEGGGSNL